MHEIASFVGQMESLGRNCEFGLVQRELGADHISLLRFAAAPMEGLIQGIQDRFDGLAERMAGVADPPDGAPETQEWWLTCQRYGILFHSGQRVSETTVDEAVSRVRPRLRWLAEKLLQDIANGEKLFVYSSAAFNNPADALPLRDALRIIGPAWLLVVVDASRSTEMKVGEVRLISDGLIGACISKLTPIGGANQLNAASWEQILPVANAIWRDQSRGHTGTTDPMAEPTLPDFDEQWYLLNNPGVAAAVASGEFESGLSHYLTHGMSEGRLPSPSKEAESTRTADDFRQRHSGVEFLTPTDLTVTPAKIKRIALIGSCVVQGWCLQQNAPNGCIVDAITLNNASEMPNLTSEQIALYDFAILQIPLRDLIVDTAVWHLSYLDISGHQAVFERACNILAYHLNNRMKWNAQYGLLTFVVNWFVPQRNPMGRLLPRFDLRNPEYFIHKLNEHLETLILKNKNAYVFDLDSLSASIGRRFTQDDSFAAIGHNAMFPLGGTYPDRIEPIGLTSEYYDIRWHQHLPEMVWAELTAMYRTIQQIDPVKVVFVDLDDTLWHGISGDKEDFDIWMIEGLPLGLAEALSYIKKRGILLSIVSKNEESRIREIWPEIFGDRLKLDDFAAVRINWCPKPENVREVLEGMNLLPRNAVFIDDNPVEREAMKVAYPDMRVLGRHPYYLKRTLLWSSETQVPVITNESSRRTEMIQAQFKREDHRHSMSSQDFLSEAAPVVRLLDLESTADARFYRAFELLNKTNQFNTTGKRWKLEECETWFREQKHILAFEVRDRFTNYGLVGVILYSLDRIEQWVMSCRVLGYQIEEAIMSEVIKKIRRCSSVAIYGRLVHTDVNFPCRDLFSRCGFRGPDARNDWELPVDAQMFPPAHVRVIDSGSETSC